MLQTRLAISHKFSRRPQSTEKQKWDVWLRRGERDLILLWRCPGHSVCWCSLSLRRDTAPTALSAVLTSGSSLRVARHPGSGARAGFAWEMDNLAQDSGYTNKPSSGRANKGLLSLWKLSIWTHFVHRELREAVGLGCRYRTSSLIFKGAAYLQNRLVLTAKKTGYYCYLSANIWISGSNCMHHGLIKLLPGALPK